MRRRKKTYGFNQADIICLMTSRAGWPGSRIATIPVSVQ